MSVLATALYGVTLVFTKVHLKNATPMAISTATLLVAAGTLMPFAAVTAPAPSTIPALAWLAAIALAFVSTTVAFIFYYRLIADIGPVKASTVTLLVPVFGMLWGVIFLGEPLTAGRVAGCAIILAGCALILGLVPLGRRTPRNV
jgi:drug/metabolite transporter (DMT)-like permease